MANLSNSQVTALLESLKLPAHIQVGEYLGSGRRAHVFKAMVHEKAAVAKVYKQDMAAKYLRKYKVDIAEFEYQRNQALYQIAGITNHIAEPYCFFGKDGEYTQSFFQEYITGTYLRDLVAKYGRVPAEIITDGYRLVELAAEHNLHDLDINSGNVIAVEHADGWRLKLRDFNLMPQHVHPPNPFLKLAFWLGIRNKSFRDYRNLEKWKNKKSEPAA